MPINDNTSSSFFDFPVFPFSENVHERGNGGNGKQVLICTSGVPSQDDGVFLEKVMAAVGIDLHADVFMVPINKGEQFSFATLDQAKLFSKALFFGLRPNDAGLNINAQKYQPLSIANKTFLFADALNIIQEKPELKRPLWEGLKAVFGN